MTRYFLKAIIRPELNLPNLFFSDLGTDNRLEVREEGAVHAHHLQGEGPAPHRDPGAAGEETEEGAGGEDSQLVRQ